MERRCRAWPKGETLDLRGLIPRQHFTQPPPRFTEATLVKELEENGIGRPVHLRRDHGDDHGPRDTSEKDKRQLKPTELGILVNDLMVESFPDIVNVGYTARMEEELDEIEEGRVDWVDALQRVPEPFEARPRARAGRDARRQARGDADRPDLRQVREAHGH